MVLDPCRGRCKPPSHSRPELRSWHRRLVRPNAVSDMLTWPSACSRLAQLHARDLRNSLKHLRTLPEAACCFTSTDAVTVKRFMPAAWVADRAQVFGPQSPPSLHSPAAPRHQSLACECSTGPRGFELRYNSWATTAHNSAFESGYNSMEFASNRTHPFPSHMHPLSLCSTAETSMEEMLKTRRWS